MACPASSQTAACAGIAGRRRGSNACQRSGDLPALRVACRCSPVGFDRQHRLKSRSRPSITYAPMSTRDEHWQNNLAFIYHSSDIQCVELLRMRRTPFFQLCDLFRSRELLKDTIHCCIEEQVAMFLHVVGHNQRFTCIKLNFRRSIETISRHF